MGLVPVERQYKEHPAATGWFVGGRLVPLPGALDADTTVWLALPVEAGRVQVWEGLAALRMGEDRVEIRAVPVFAYDLNYGDEVSVVASAEGPLVATGIVKDGGNYTFRVWFPEGALQAVVAEFGALGCLVESYSARLVGLSCGAGEAQMMADALQAGEAAGRFLYETGRQR